MRREPQTERPHLQHAHPYAFVLAILLSAGTLLIVEAAAAPPPPAFVGTFTSPYLCSPRGIDLSPSGDVFVGSECNNFRMVHFTALGGLVDTWTFPVGPSPPHGGANGVALDGSGNVFVVDDETGDRVEKYTSSGALLASWRNVGPAPSVFSLPIDLAVDGAGDVFVAEYIGQRVRELTNGGSYLRTFGSAGSGPGQFQEPAGIGLDASGRLYVADSGRLRILRFQANGTFDMEFATPAVPYDVAVGPDGNVYIIYFDGPVSQYSPSGVLLNNFAPPGGLAGAFRIAISPDGAIFITEQSNTRVTKFQIQNATSSVRTSFGRLKAMYR